jgi:putative restriction endonuclease
MRVGRRSRPTRFMSLPTIAAVERDDELRARCFLALDALRAEFGDDIPYRGGLDRGFVHEGRRVPFLTYQKGIHRAAAQRGPAALSITTSYESPYDDQVVPNGLLYAYRAGSADHVDNRSLRAAFELGVPLVYFVGVRPGWYAPLYPVWIEDDLPEERCVRVVIGDLDRAGPTPILVRPHDELERRYLLRTTRMRLHQARFRGLVLRAYRDQCTICRLKEVRLLDATHILPDARPEGVASVTNGLSLCTIHHRAYDQGLLAVAPDYRVHVGRRLLEDDDGPMLALLQRFHKHPIALPPSRRAWPDRERLALRYEQFLSRA